MAVTAIVLLAAACRGPGPGAAAGAAPAAAVQEGGKGGLAAGGPRLSAAAISTDVVVFEGVTVRAGDHVRIRKRAGTFKPGETGHSVEVVAEAGRTGVALGGVRREGFGDETIRVVLVRFDPQVWREWPNPMDEAALSAFEATIHIEHIAVVTP